MVKRLPKDRGALSFKHFSSLTLVLRLLLALGVTGCAPFGNSRDPAVEKGPTYRQPHELCEGLKLDRSELDAPMARRLISCLNSNGSLKELALLVDRVSDSQLQEVVGFLNRNLLTDRTLLYEIDESFKTLREKQLLTPFFKSLGQVLAQDEWLSATFSLFRESLEKDDQNEFLRSLGQLGVGLDEPAFAKLLDYGRTVLESQAFHSMTLKFREANHPRDSRPGVRPSARDFRQLSNLLHHYLETGDEPGAVSSIERLLAAAAQGSLLGTLDDAVGRTESDLKKRVPEVASSFVVSMRDDGKIMGGITSLFHYLHAPVSCLNGAMLVPDGSIHLMREVSRLGNDAAIRFLTQRNMLTYIFASSYCKYSRELGKHYGALLDLSETSGMDGGLDLVRAFYRNSLGGLFADFMSDTGSGRGSEAEDQGRLKGILPVFSEWSERGLWDDVFYLITLPRDEDRSEVQAGLRFWTDPVATLGGKSIHSGIAGALARTSPEGFHRFLTSFRPLIESDQGILTPLLRDSWNAYHANDAHPSAMLMRRVLLAGSGNKAFLKAVFEISDLPQFKPVLRMSSEMAQDGRMEEVFASALSIFRHFAQQGKTRELHEAATLPIFIPKARHDLSADQVGFARIDELKHPPVSSSDPCRKLDMSFALSDVSSPHYNEQIQTFIACLNRDQDQAIGAWAMTFLAGEKGSTGETYFQKVVNILSKVQFPLKEGRDLISRISALLDDGRFSRIVGILPVLNSQSVTRLGIQVLRPWTTSGPKQIERFRRVANSVADATVREDLPELLSFLESVVSGSRRGQQPGPGQTGDRQSFDLAEIRNWIFEKECKSRNRNCPIDKRLREILQDYREGVNNWETLGGRARLVWGWRDFSPELEPLIKRLAGPSVVESLMRVMEYFKKGPNEPVTREHSFEIDDLVKWLYSHSTDHRLIQYRDFEAESPRVRLVNSLDRLELLIFNSDFIFWDTDLGLIPVEARINNGYRFLAILANAWGDESPEAWPKAAIHPYFLVKDRRTGKMRPRTLAEAFREMKRTLDLFDAIHAVLPAKYAARLFNIKQVLPVIEENLTGGQPGGLKVLRNLLYQIYMSNPADLLDDPIQGFHEQRRNTFSLVSGLVRVGMLRQVGQLIRQLPDPAALPAELSPEDQAEQKAMIDFHRALIHGATHPGTIPLLRKLLNGELSPGRGRSEAHGLLWKTFERIFAALEQPDPGGGPDQSAARLKKLAFYLIIEVEDLNLFSPLLETGSAILDEHAAYLATQTRQLDGILRSEEVPEILKNLYASGDQAGKRRLGTFITDYFGDSRSGGNLGSDLVGMVRVIDEDPQSHQAFVQLAERWAQVQASAEYRKLDWVSLGKDCLHFFEETPNGGRPATAVWMRRLLADQIRSPQSGPGASELEEWLTLATRKPDQISGVIDALAQWAENGQLEDFFQMARRSLLPVE